MCSYFQQTMGNNYQAGDLADIVRASSGGCFDSTSVDLPAGEAVAVTDWQFSYDNLGVDELLMDGFGDPFCNTRDPFLDLLPISSSGFFNSSTTGPIDIMIKTIGTDEVNCSAGGVDDGVLLSHQMSSLDDEEMIKRPCSNNNNMFSKMHQISPINTKQPISSCECNSPKSHDLVSNDHMIGANSSKSCLAQNGTAGLQISSSLRNTTAIKQRKNQAKKVVCIPAPANSRPTGEVVPSDLWAWRKYGQKPIKGSPYPRGYYRCSSSKGCSARKQVERSRTDPNMLVITYTSEHNHPWPTQRNALAGSSRSSQPTKNNNNSSSKNLSASFKS